jgi:hypothetical protein
VSCPIAGRCIVEGGEARGFPQFAHTLAIGFAPKSV